MNASNLNVQGSLEAVVALEAAKRAHTKQYAHDYVDILDHWIQILGQIWPLRLFRGYSGLGGCQKGPHHISNMHMDK